MTPQPAKGNEQVGGHADARLNLLLVLLPVVPAMLVYGVSGALMTGGAFKQIAIGLPSDPASYAYWSGGTVVGQEMNARYFVLTGLLVLIVASVAATATALWVLHRNFEPVQNGQARNDAAFNRIAAIVGLASVTALAWIWWFHHPQFHKYVGYDVFETLAPLYFTGRAGFAFDQTFVIQTLPRFASTLSVIPGAGIVACGLTFTLRCWQAPTDPRPTYEETRSYALERLAQLKILLTAYSALFVAAVLYSKAYLAWPLAIMQGDAAKQYSAAVEGFITYEGVRFALVLFALLVCMHLAVRWSAIRLAHQEKAKLLAEPGLTFSVPQIMQSTATVIAPLLVGPVADALKSIAQA